MASRVDLGSLPPSLGGGGGDSIPLPPGVRCGVPLLPGGRVMRPRLRRPAAIFGHVPVHKRQWDDFVGGHIRTMELITRTALPTDVRSLHTAKGVWKCRNRDCVKYAPRPFRGHARVMTAGGSCRN